MRFPPTTLTAEEVVETVRTLTGAPADLDAADAFERTLAASLWAWRDEFGGEREWAGQLGADVRERGSDEAWSLITAESIHGSIDERTA
jgi:hypothetical protein